mmetsp:Transcript_8507/g.13899  ORF Transcript_8507/g.13899 Transcript_8507/m.13899 type:complete len:580 (-) Transcript_8507:548-2287(-)|eukprot:CAMPEP_0184656186 /NCGR_PEP_ID=MMETSP0308-20130426/15920_1 /TAXON_ID=38269 /ORGANISM="Gloeochaete witrockiana, Strain SAG 46.84" /LENGTH=579 /DNA_ID=CAMNT_0027093181 /DNA_START=111 /DNA_END=1850 /DNA_ORIENTATION=+
MATPAEFDVLVCGAGPSGLAFALSLAKLGVKSIKIVEQNSGVCTWTAKTILVHPRTLEIFDRLGIADQMIKLGVQHNEVSVYSPGYTKPLTTVDFTQDTNTVGCNFHFLLGISQRDLEAILVKELLGHGIEVQRNTQVVSVDSKAPGGVKVVLTNSSDGKTEVVHTKFVAGADGANSTVRTQVGISFEGTPKDEELFVAKCRLIGNKPETNKGMHVSLAADHSVLVLTQMANNRHKILISKAATEHSSPVGYANSREVSVDEIEAELSKHEILKGSQIHDPVFLGHYRSVVRLAAKYSTDDLRVHLIGDAAHNPSPTGGQGMDTGIQDGYNLSWKISMALRRDPNFNEVRTRALLTSYELERRSIAKHVVDESLKLYDSVVPITAARSIVNTLSALALGGDSHDESSRRFSKELNPGLNLSYSDVSNIVPKEPPPSSSFLFKPVEFKCGPKPGERAINAPGVNLQHCLSYVKHTLFYFVTEKDANTNLSATIQAVDAAIRDIAEDVEARFIVHSTYMAFQEKRMVWDRQGEVFKAYGLHREDHNIDAIYIIRPDGYVFSRKVPSNLSSVESLMQQVYPL